MEREGRHMARIGISIYPEHTTPERDRAYMEMAAKYGCSRIFSCLLSVTKSREEIGKEFRGQIDFAHRLGMEVILDVAPVVLKRLGVTYDDLSFFSEIHADGIRLDEGFDSLAESIMTYNPQNLKIEMNASLGNRYLENIMSHCPKTANLTTCHNFYPQRYTGLGHRHFEKCSREIHKLGLPVAAFVSSQEPNAFGPWPVNDGLCTLEMHRDLPVDTAARHLFATGLVDDVLIANCYASEEELRNLSLLDPSLLTFRMEREYTLSCTEEKILYETLHFVRGDMSDFMARSTQSRVLYADQEVPARNTRDMKRGDVVIVNDEYNRYKGELQIVLMDMENDGRKNVIGHLPANERMLLDYLEPWRKFGFIKS